MITLLIVDSYQNQRTLCRLELEDEGYRILEAEDTGGALVLVREERPDLVVCAPSKQGAEWVQHLLEIKSVCGGCPVIVYSADPLRDINSARGCADAWVVKSSNLQPLKEMVYTVLGRDASPGYNRGIVLRAEARQPHALMQ